MVNKYFLFQFRKKENVRLGNNDNCVGTNSNTSTLSSPTLPIYYDGHSNSPPLSNSMTPHCMYKIRKDKN
jgi:hypothetical protein